MDAPKLAENPELAVVGQLESCTGAVIDTAGSDDAPAYVLTAGHCFLEAPNEIHLNQPWQGVFTVGHEYQSTEAPTELPLAAVEYATLHHRDLAVVRLAVTLGELRDLGLEPLALATSAPEEGEDIAIVGHPHLGWLQRSRCTQGLGVHVAEADYWWKATSNGCSGISGGSSGSPVMNAAGEVFGVHFTSSGGGLPCSLNSPCELGTGPLANASSATRYTSLVPGLARCFENGTFDATLAACPLTRAPLPAAVAGVSRFVPPPPGAEEVRWNVTVGESAFPWYRYKLGDVRDIRCDDDGAYGKPRLVASQPLIEDVVPWDPSRSDQRIYLLCVQGGTSADSFIEPDRTLSFLAEFVSEPAPESP